jgi:transposase
VSTVAQVKRDLRDWQLTRCLFVGDAGMVSAANLKALAAGGGKYLMCMPMRRGDALTQQVLARAGRHRTVNERLQIKEVVIGDGERRLRYVVCFNPEEATRQQAHRRHLLDHLEAELAAMGDAAQDVQSKRVAALRSSSRYGKYLSLGTKGLQLEAKAIKAAEHYDGKFLVHGNDDTLSAEDMALGYKQMIRVEQAWRDMKSTLEMRPVFHWAPHRIHSHVAITVLSLLLERTIEHACADTWRSVSDRLRRIQLAQLLSPHGTVWQVTDPTPEAAKCLNSMQIKPPPPVLQRA